VAIHLGMQPRAQGIGDGHGRRAAAPDHQQRNVEQTEQRVDVALGEGASVAIEERRERGRHGRQGIAVGAPCYPSIAVQAHEPFERLVALARGRRVIALTGAGCSTGSGIPDYRGPDAPVRKRPPIQYREFVGDVDGRQRYWARAVVGWPRLAAAEPNPAHLALADLEHRGIVVGLITQNVDRLHHRAGSVRVVELHGALHEARCLGCDALEDRDALQGRLLALNPGFAELSALAAPDGDADLPDDLVDRFVVAPCRACGGVLKPDVVFFGESVRRPVVQAAFDLLDVAQLLLVVGSSLMVLSGLRFVREAARRGVDVAIVNLGPTRGDPQATLHVDGDVADVLPALADRLHQT
jgi:NAD-dependent SIR2 family protein deacetylase